MKRIVSLLLVLLMLVFAFASCKSAGDENTDSDIESNVGDATGDISNTQNGDKTTEKGENNNVTEEDEDNKTEKPTFNVKESSKGLKFELNPDKLSYTLVGKGSCIDKEIFIDGYNGLPVTVIGYGALMKNTVATSVTVGDNVEVIEGYAFWDCTKITKVTLGKKVRVLGNGVFYGCTALTSATLGSSLEKISYRAFYNCKNLSTIKIPDSVLCIGEEAFANTAYYNNSSNWQNKVLYIGNHLILAKTDISGSYTVKSGTVSIAEMALRGCKGLTSVTVPDSVKGIGAISFANCDNMKTIKLGKNIEYIGDRAFINTGYYKDAGNWENNILYLDSYLIAAKTTLTGAITIKSGTKAICDTVFKNCKKITSVTIPDSMVYIGEYSFFGCSGMTKITIGSGIKRIGVMAFKDCVALNSVTFKNPDGWEADGISIDKEILGDKSNAIGQIYLYSDKTWRRS